LHLLELINDILDLSKVEAGQMKVERIPCDLQALLSEVVSADAPRAQEKGLGFEVVFRRGDSAADPDRLGAAQADSVQSDRQRHQVH
jgi:signal transduction histidine kinase